MKNLIPELRRHARDVETGNPEAVISGLEKYIEEEHTQELAFIRFVYNYNNDEYMATVGQTHPVLNYLRDINAVSEVYGQLERNPHSS